MTPKTPVPDSPQVRGVWRTRGRKTVIGMHVGLALLLSGLLWGLANHLARRHHARTNISSSLFYQLSDRTRALLGGLTNEVQAVLVMSREHPLYTECESLLREYAATSGKVRAEFVDPDADTSRVRQLVETYNLPTEDKAFVLWAASPLNKRVVRVADLAAEEAGAPVMPPGPDGAPAPKPQVFRGEAEYTSALLHVLNPVHPRVYFLQGHGERDLDDYEPNRGYAEIRKLLEQDNFDVRPLQMNLDTGVPADCAALVIAGPKFRLSQPEIDLLGAYLASRNGRVLMLLDRLTETGLEPVLEDWGVKLGNDLVVDAVKTLDGTQLIINHYARHPVTQNLDGVMSMFNLPRSVESLQGRDDNRVKPEDRPRFTHLASCSKNGWAEKDLQSYPITFDPATDIRGPVNIAGAVEKGADSRTVSVSPTRLVVIGDSQFATNRPLSGGGMRLFVNAVRWLAEGPKSPVEIPGKPLREQRLEFERKDIQLLFFALVGALPGLVALLGGLVWLRRRS
ncbi:MAG: GldG family protein [Kiritimatiellia bacterium]